MGKIIVGQEDVLYQILTAMLARGHCLMVGVPGLAKTLIVRTLSAILDLDFKRVQFTPDLMPSDITGTDILEIDEATGAKNFRFIKGPIFTNMLLADEINRTPPKTQAALLEAMQERSVTASGYTYRLAEPFFVLATQNPLEQEGTYPLPEAQLDRFMFNILVDYPKEEEEEDIVRRTTYREMPEPKRVLNGPAIITLQKIVWQVPVPDSVIRYATALVRASRPGSGSLNFINESVQCGAGPRACQYLILGAKSRAVLHGRLEAAVDDVKAIAVPVLRHRIFVNFNALSQGISATDIVRKLLESVVQPPDGNPIRRERPKSGGELKLALPQQLKEEEAVDIQTIKQMRHATGRIRDEVQKVIVGQDEVLDLILMAMLAKGHCLMVGVPGLAKTLTVRTIASVLDLDFSRIQFTPDLMPSDITGTDILEEDERTGEKAFRFIKGPVFTNILLADEINRTPPKTQAALLEAMQEYNVTASGNTYHLDPPFFVLATQNPLEQEGTYPLPEAQLDRFMFNIWVDYPNLDEENVIVKETTRLETQEPRKVLGSEEILVLQEIVRRVPVSDHVVKYATRLVRATRPKMPDSFGFINDWVYCGAGPRACQYLILGAKARAVIRGRANVSCKDVRFAANPVLRHRIFTNFNADSEGVTTVDIVNRVLKEVPEPEEKDYAAAKEEEAASVTEAVVQRKEEAEGAAQAAAEGKPAKKKKKKPHPEGAAKAEQPPSAAR
jgi:MoxR-like ATPase